MTDFRAIDLSTENGLMCGKMLADLGADVIMVEPPGGSSARKIGPFYHDISDPEKSLFWLAHNVNKRGITLNIELEEGRDLFKRLIAGADCVIESFTPGYLDKLDLGYSALRKLNPRIIMTSITPFGQTGVYSKYAASDLVLQAMSGWDCGEPDRAPLRWGGEQSLVLPGIAAVSATMIALYAREHTGCGQHVDVSMRESLCWCGFVPLQALFWEFGKEIKVREGNQSMRGAVKVSTIYKCADGYISWRLWTGSMARLTRNAVNWLCDLGIAGELDAIDWAKIDLLSAKQGDWNKYEQAFTDAFMKFTKHEIYEAAGKWKFIAVPVSGARDIFNNPQLEARNYFGPMEHRELGASILYPGNWFKSTNSLNRVNKRAPLPGENNQDIYVKELGMPEHELTNLKSKGVI